MIPYAPHPVLFSIGPLAIHYYSLAYIIGFIIAYYAIKKQHGSKIAEDSLTWIVLSTIIGGRLGYFLFYNPATFVTDPLEVLMLWHGGMSFHGAIIAIFIGVYWYCTRNKVPFWQLADALVIPAAIGLGLGRIANFLNGELVGTITTVSWCMEFPGFAGCRHPSQLYESFYSFIIAGILYYQSKKPAVPGNRFWQFVTLYGFFRFLVTFLRDDPRVFGISEGQLFSLIMFCVGAWMLGTKYKKRDLRKKS